MNLNVQKMKINKLQLLDDHIHVLCKKIENLSDELKQVVHERDILVDHLGIITWPFDAIITNDNNNSIISQTKSSPLTTSGMTTTAFNTLNENKIKLNDEKEQDLISFEINRNEEEEAFDRDLPTPRGVFMSDRISGWHSGVIQGPTSESLLSDVESVKVIENEDNCSMIGDIISDINSPNFEAFEEQELKPTLNDTTFDELNLCLEDDDEGDEDEDDDDDGEPSLWYSNTAFGDEHPPIEPLLNNDEINNSDHSDESQVQLKTCRTALIERANRARCLADELRQTRYALKDNQAQLEFVTDKMSGYKKMLKSEMFRRESEIKELRAQLNEATMSKFITFCKLQDTRQRLETLEKLAIPGSKELIDLINPECMTMADIDLAPRHDYINSCRNESIRSSDDICEKCNCSSKSNNIAGKIDFEQNPLYDSLCRTMQQLLESEKRNDALLARTSELEIMIRQNKKGSSLMSRHNTSFKDKSKTQHNEGKIRKQKKNIDIEQNFESEKQQTQNQIKQIKRTKSDLNQKRVASGKFQRWK